jgi:hypothetical protein
LRKETPGIAPEPPNGLSLLKPALANSLLESDLSDLPFFLESVLSNLPFSLLPPHLGHLRIILFSPIKS